MKDPQTYNIESFLSAADQDFILIITRLSHLEAFETTTKITRVESKQALRILINNSLQLQSTSDNSVFR